MDTSRAASRHARWITTGVLFASLLVTSCGQHRARESTSAGSGAPAGVLLAPSVGIPTVAGTAFSHMPLAVGNRWIYEIRVRSRLVEDGPTGEVMTRTDPWVVEIIGQATLNEQDYFVELDYDPRLGAPTGLPFLVREDATGFYNMDAPTLAPSAARSAPDLSWLTELETELRARVANSPHRAAFEAAIARQVALLRIATPLALDRSQLPRHPGLPRPGEQTGFRPGRPRPGEITLLSYPIHRGARWIVRESPRFTRSVVTREHVTVPAGEFQAWRIRGDAELFGPRDHVTFWYSREGMVRLKGRFESEAVDDQGNPLGMVIFDVEYVLMSLNLSPTLAQNQEPYRP
jgi:hypothetical protein